jgi:prolyl-tRNA synthetase
MKDLYTFDLTEEVALITYENVRSAYRNFFHELGIPFLEVGASSGNMGGTLSHEFHFPSSAGEDTILACQSCGYAANEEVVDKAAKLSQKCPSCEERALSAQRAIEVGHTFHLGTRYSEPLNAVVTIPKDIPKPDSKSDVNLWPSGKGTSQTPHNNQQMVPLQMGCHGIGVSRLVGAIATMTADKKGLCWPLAVAPYHVVFVFDGTEPPPSVTKHQFSVRSTAKWLCEHLTFRSYSQFSGNLDCVVDDRDKPLPWKLKDADLVGYPITVVLGRKWAETGEYEIQCRSRPDLSHNALDIGTALRDLLEGLSPPRSKPGWLKWRLNISNDSSDKRKKQTNHTTKN